MRSSTQFCKAEHIKELVRNHLLASFYSAAPNEMLYRVMLQQGLFHLIHNAVHGHSMIAADYHLPLRQLNKYWVR
jgi:hypothetical protein